jgi:hypothetical protein
MRHVEMRHVEMRHVEMRHVEVRLNEVLQPSKLFVRKRGKASYA